jgi:hypothetical protein
MRQGIRPQIGSDGTIHSGRRAKPDRRNKVQRFPVLTIDTAPEKSRPALQALQGAFGMIPNIAGVMAMSPVLIDSLVALLQQGLNQADVQAIRERRVPKDATSAALSTFARIMIEKRGRVDDHDVDTFVSAGFSKEHALEVIAVVAASTITNYTASVTKPPVEAPFQAYAWSA